MDYIQRGIIDKIELIEASNIGGKYTTLSGLYKVLIEYLMYLLFACEWSHAERYLPREVKREIVNDLRRPVVGKLLGAILKCDENDKNGLLEGKQKEFQKNINQFIEKRNRTSAHGTVIPNIQESIWREVYECYRNVYNNIIKLNIRVLSGQGKFYYRDTEDPTNIVTFDLYKVHFLSLDSEMISDLGLEEGNLSFLVETEVFRVAPFLMVKRENNFDYSFFDYSSYNIANNKFEYCKVSDFDNEPRYSQIVPGYFQSFQEENMYTFCKANGIICNKFENNYDSFIAIEPITRYVSQIWDFISNSKSNVCLTIRGGGGVGKTALIQYICTKYLFEPFSIKTIFEYVIFCSAKDRELKQTMNIAGAIQKTRTNDTVHDYKGVLNLIGSVLGWSPQEKAEDVENIEKAIVEQSGILLIIDDFETFADSEKKKIVALISKLSIDKHKVIITTRSQYMIGEEYYIKELNQKQVLAFLREIFINKSSGTNNLSLIADYDAFISVEENKEYIYKMSQGLPLLTLQLAKVLTISGFSKEAMPQKWNDDVEEFLLGRLYSYFNTQTSKILFIAIAQYFKCGSSDIALSELAIIYRLYCMYFKLDDVDYELDLQEVEKLKIIYLTPDYVRVGNNISGSFLEKCKGDLIASGNINRLVFDDRLIKLCIANGIEKAALEYLEIADRYMEFEYVKLFALDNCLNYLNSTRFEIIKNYVLYKIDSNNIKSLHHLYNECAPYFVMEDEFNEFFSNICLKYSYILPELEEWMSHKHKALSPEYLIAKLIDELEEIMDDIQVYIDCRRKSDIPHGYKIELRQKISGKIGTVSNYTIKELCNYNLEGYTERLQEIKAVIEEICVVPEFNMMAYESCKKLFGNL